MPKYIIYKKIALVDPRSLTHYTKYYKFFNVKDMATKSVWDSRVGPTCQSGCRWIAAQYDMLRQEATIHSWQAPYACSL